MLHTTFTLGRFRTAIGVSFLRLLFTALAATALLACSGDGGGSRPEPPPGQGSIFVDNQTRDGIEVFVNGFLALQIGRGGDDSLNLEPGLYRFVITQTGGSNATFTQEVDVLLGRITVFEVFPGGPGQIAVEIRIENP